MLSTIMGFVLDIGLGAIALGVARDLRKIVTIHEGRIAALEKYTGFTLA